MIKNFAVCEVFKNKHSARGHSLFQRTMLSVQSRCAGLYSAVLESCTWHFCSFSCYFPSFSITVLSLDALYERSQDDHSDLRNWKDEAAIPEIRMTVGGSGSFLKNFIYFNWRTITSQHCGGPCHTLARISHECTCVPLSWTPLPSPSPPHSSELSQSTSFECPASCIEQVFRDQIMSSVLDMWHLIGLLNIQVSSWIEVSGNPEREIWATDTNLGVKFKDLELKEITRVMSSEREGGRKDWALG